MIVSAVIGGILWMVCAIWTIYDSVTGGPGRWYHLLPSTMCVLICAVNIYQYLKDEKSDK